MIRLLKIGDGGRATLTAFDGKEIPAYAILSHTWGPKDTEVTYQDILKGQGTTKPGYAKIEFCAKQAARNGLLYFWVDTCCIDKSSSEELSRAIRSMFKWYSSATRCYAYLSDVPDTDDHTSTLESSFPKSRWFTRGWTLQELIAPKSVDFFSRSGEHLGSKELREQQISDITGIAIEALQGKPLSEFSEDDLMFWGAKRETSLEEDAAYCMLGIFDLHIPVLYGEGRQSAMDRLRTGIQSRTQLELLTLSDAPWIVPFERNSRFTGREPELTRLEQSLFRKDSTSRIAVTGLGGMGKTQLVLEHLFRMRVKHKDCSVFWIPATSAEALHQGYVDVARQLNIPGWEDQKNDTRKLVQMHLSKSDAGKWVLVFDNADDLNMWISNPSSEHDEKGIKHGSLRLIDCLPKHKQGCIVFTTRDEKVGHRLAQQNIINLHEMETGSATKLLKNCLANPDNAEDQQKMPRLLSELTFLPLAIVQAAAYINEHKTTITEYLSLLADKEENVIDLLSEDFEDDGRYRDVKNPVATTWLISMQQIQQRDSLALSYLSFLACISPKDVPLSILPPGPSKKREMEAIGILAAYSFVNKRPADTALDLHRLVHLATRNWLRHGGLLKQSTERALTHLKEIFPDNDHKNRSRWRIYLKHAHEVLESDLVNTESASWRELMENYRACLSSDGRWNEAELVLHRLLEMDKGLLGLSHPHTLTTMHNLAATFHNQGRWDEAEKLHLQVLEARKEKLGPDHPDTLNSMGNLATTFMNQGRWDEAEKLELQVLEASKEKLGPDHPQTLASMANLATTFWNQGRWDEAEKLELQVLKARKEKLGPDHPDTLTSMANLATTFWNQGRWDEAEKLQLQVLEARKEKLGPDHPQTLASMANLATTFWNQGRWDEAEKLELQVLEASKEKLGPDHPDTLTSMANLATTFWNQGRWDEAEKLELQVFEASKEKLGPDHPDTLTSMNNLAVTWMKQSRGLEATKLMSDCLERRRRVVGVSHPDTLASQAWVDKWESNQAGI